MRKRTHWQALLLVLALSTYSYAQSSSDPTATLEPATPTSSSYTYQRLFDRDEDAYRFGEQFTPFVNSGCLHGTSASLTGTFTATPCVAYPAGWRVSDSTTTVNYTAYAAATDICYLAIDRDTTGSNANWSRVSGTHYLIDCTSATLPAAPTYGIVLLSASIVTSAINSVIDLRPLAPRPLGDPAPCTFDYNPSNLVDGAGETKAFTCTGAVPGDTITVGPGAPITGLLFSASVTNADNCSLRLQNESTANVDVIDSTWTCHIKHN